MEIERIAAEVQRASRGGAWHGPALEELLADIDATQAAARPIAGAHSIWELVLHLAGWTREVTRRLEGGEPALPPGGDWPSPGKTTADEWARACADLRAAHEGLTAVVKTFPESRLDTPVTTRTDTPSTPGSTYYEMLHGLMQHDAYHGGQIGLLKKSLRVRND